MALIIFLNRRALAPINSPRPVEAKSIQEASQGATV
jgi:hypothetical protein